tara:strand:+ start:1736 stop:2383 length:648 start_codon:yes stop_codon:yes gene_type:complete
MWILVYNNQIELGPRQWNRWIFQSWLDENLGLSVNLPQQPPDSNPLIINENTRIIFVFFAPEPSYNSRIQQLSGPFLTVSHDYANASWQVADQDIEAVKLALLAQLAANRYQQETAGTTISLQDQALLVSTDRVSRQAWLNALQLNVETQTWKFNNNTWLILNNQEIQTVVSALAAHVEQAFAREKTLHDQIVAAGDLATLAAIDINWPVVNPIA